MLLWLWGRLTATTLIPPLAWEPPYAVSMALKKNKNKAKQKRIHDDQVGFLPGMENWKANPVFENELMYS